MLTTLVARNDRFSMPQLLRKGDRLANGWAVLEHPRNVGHHIHILIGNEQETHRVEVNGFIPVALEMVEMEPVD